MHVIAGAVIVKRGICGKMAEFYAKHCGEASCSSRCHENWTKKQFGFQVITHYFRRQIEGGISIMLIIPVKEGESIDRALKKFKKKFEKTGVVKELRSRQAYTKKSVSRREEIKKAAYITNLKREEM
jgi:small subunit ribosomal protein S21